MSEHQTALIQIEILPVHDRKKYISTGIYIKKSQWDPRNNMIINHALAAQLNNRINDFIVSLRTREMEIIESGRMMDVSDIDIFINKPERSSNSFIDFAFKELSLMKLSSGARYLHERTLNNLKDCGIERFHDLTYKNITEFDRHIKKTLKAQTSVSKQHSVVKTYLILAQKNNLFKAEKNPYNEFHVPKGKSKIRTRLDDTDIENMGKAVLFDAKLELCRDAYLFQVYTGLSFRDLQTITKEMIRHNNEGDWIEGLRKKNGELYTVFLIDQAKVLLKKHDGLIKPLSYEEQKRKLKIVAAAAGIDKNVTPHSARHSAASWMLRKGIPVAVIQQILGHSDIETTLIYARLEKQTIMDEMKKLSKQ